jgi:RHS repeat-associated protein
MVEVYFDDFKVTQVKSPVIASNDYYPFGLAFNSYQRENSVVNDYKYSGKEEQTELGLGWLDFGARMYDPAIARWMAVDPLSELSRRWSPYTFVYNNQNGEYLGTDGIDDKKVYQTTDAAYDSYVSVNTDEGKGGEADFEGLKSSDDTDYLGKTNEFGLIQLTGMGNEHIENHGNEDTYSYTDKQGNTVAAGQHGDDWVTPSVGAAFNAAVNEFVSQPGNSDKVVKVNDASAFNPAYNLGHSTHFSGESIDAPFIKTNGTHSNDISNLSQADKNLTGNFVGILQGKGFTKNYSDQGSIPNTTHSKNHKDHFHVGKP